MIERLGEVGTLSPEMELEFPVWRIWLETKIPPDQIKNDWTYPDLLKALAVLDMKEAYTAGFEGIEPVK